ncbi:AmmeMemoRadiSam system radical SAM enzyme [bacterium]|nr:AmmeMemoRadiSam system radical SAM enzyme [bacterium]
MREAMLYQTVDGGVQCGLCAQGCVITDGEKGRCSVRRNRAGRLYTLVYGRAAALNIDPIEKKPLFHFLPGTLSLSLGTLGCNLRCAFCQNWSLSRGADDCPPDDARQLSISPDALITHCLNQRIPSISFTYNEPTVFFEYAYETCRLARQHGIRTVFVSNGYQSPAAMELLAPVLDAINIDLKSFSDEFYREYCGGRLAPVLETIKLVAAYGIWQEIITLVIPELNDDPAELAELAGFIAGVDPGIPWHVNAFHPDHKMRDRPPTPVRTLERARRIGLDAGLKYVYIGNIVDRDSSSTWCPECGQRLIDRWQYPVASPGANRGHCRACHAKIEGVWE